jgi:hypothetical protein
LLSLTAILECHKWPPIYFEPEEREREKKKKERERERERKREREGERERDRERGWRERSYFSSLYGRRALTL